MTAENPNLDTYGKLVKEAQDFTFISSIDNQLVTGSTVSLASAILDAVEAGFSREATLAAIREGEMRGLVRWADPKSQYQNEEYWEAVRAEFEAFWAKRYNPDAPDEW